MPKKVRIALPPGWKAEGLNPRMRAVCSVCAEAPSGPFRLVRVIDAYPYPTAKVYCVRCAVRTMRESLREQEVMLEALEGLYAEGARSKAPEGGG